MFQIKTIIAAAAALVAAGSAAFAAPVAVRDNPNIAGDVFKDGLFGAVDVEYLGEKQRVDAGAFVLQYGSEAEGWTDFYTFCLQFAERLRLPNTYEMTSGGAYFTDAADRNAIGAIYNYLLTPETGFASAEAATALQLMIWEIVEDGAANFNLSLGTFILKSYEVEVFAEAARLWDLVLAGLADGSFSDLGVNVFVGEGTQDLVLETPLPGALSLLLSGLAGLGFAARTRKRA